jgi:hypothetical protein
MMEFAPIVLFVYNRPLHTVKTIEALRYNKHASESELIIYSDFPQFEKHRLLCNEVTKSISQLNGFKSIEIIERKNKYDLAKSIVSGVTEVVNAFGRIIVLEDDIVNSPFFLKYMNEALDFYYDNPRVMHVSGYMFPINNPGLPETFFLSPASFWGWGTWEHEWEYFDKNPKKIMDKSNRSMIRKFNFDGTNNYFRQVKKNYKQFIDTWAIFWPPVSILLTMLFMNDALNICKNTLTCSPLALGERLRSRRLLRDFKDNSRHCRIRVYP